MMYKIAPYIVKTAIRENQLSNQTQGDKKRKTLAQCEINIDFLEATLSRIFSFRHNPSLSSRIRFKVQDLIDEYQKEWKCVIYGERKVVDDEGF